MLLQAKHVLSQGMQRFPRSLYSEMHVHIPFIGKAFKSLHKMQSSKPLQILQADRHLLQVNDESFEYHPCGQIHFLPCIIAFWSWQIIQLVELQLLQEISQDIHAEFPYK